MWGEGELLYYETIKRELMNPPIVYLHLPYKRARPTPPVQLVYFQQNKKRRKPKVKKVTLQLCGVRKRRYSLYEKLPTCAA
jgi:hypothetical protein